MSITYYWNIASIQLSVQANYQNISIKKQIIYKPVHCHHVYWLRKWIYSFEYQVFTFYTVKLNTDFPNIKKMNIFEVRILFYCIKCEYLVPKWIDYLRSQYTLMTVLLKTLLLSSLIKTSFGNLQKDLNLNLIFSIFKFNLME